VLSFQSGARIGGMPAVNFDTSRYGIVNDAAYDGLGRRLATASSDKVVRIWGADQGTVLAELKGHRSSVVTLSWASGRFASLLVSGGDDGQVVVWQEARAQDWQPAHQINVTGAANVVAFCPSEYGLMIAVAGSDDLGIITTLSRREASGGGAPGGNQPWQVRSFPAHQGGVSSLSWAPSKTAATMATGPAVGRAVAVAPCRLASCGADGVVSIWHCELRAVEWRKQHELTADTFNGLPRDVAWRPNIGLPCSQVAACTDEGAVAVWVQDMDGQPWRLQSCWNMSGDARRLTWSRSGCLLAVSIGDSSSCVFREGRAGAWEKVSSLDQ